MQGTVQQGGTRSSPWVRCAQSLVAQNVEYVRFRRAHWPTSQFSVLGQVMRCAPVLNVEIHILQPNHLPCQSRQYCSLVVLGIRLPAGYQLRL